jgi:hypothetical protein
MLVVVVVVVVAHSFEDLKDKRPRRTGKEVVARQRRLRDTTSGKAWCVGMKWTTSV